MTHSTWSASCPVSAALAGLDGSATGLREFLDVVVQALHAGAPVRGIWAEVRAIGLACLHEVGSAATVQLSLATDQLLTLHWRQEGANL